MEKSVLNANIVALITASPQFTIVPGDSEIYVNEIRRNPAFSEFSDAEISVAVKEAVQAEIIRRNMAARQEAEKRRNVPADAAKVETEKRPIPLLVRRPTNQPVNAEAARRAQVAARGGVGNTISTGKTARRRAKAA